MDQMHKNYVNFLAGNPLNRLSWKRSDSKLLNNYAQHAKWIVFNKGQPLVQRTKDERTRGLAYLDFQRVHSFLGEIGDPLFGQGKELRQTAPENTPTLESARIRGARALFLGVLNPSDSESNVKVEGIPYFAFDVGETAKELDALLQPLASDDWPLSFVEPRGASMSFSPFDAGLFAEARSMIDWNTRNKFCPACGSPTYSMWAGWKLSCSTLLPWVNKDEKEPCASGTGLQNYVHPRTDPVVIVAVLNQRKDKILLGRNTKFPTGFYSCLAGFLEPGESIEEGVKREVFEESGVTVANVDYHSSQPWPYPANLMIGCYGIAEQEEINLMDGELAEANFFSKDEVLQVLAHPQGAVIRKAEYKKFDEDQEGHTTLAVDDKQASVLPAREPVLPISFRVPPITAIAGVLISEWAHGRAQKANL